MKKSFIENFKQVDYIPLQSYVVNLQTSGNEIMYSHSQQLLEHALENVLIKFEVEIQATAKKMIALGVPLMREGIRLEFSMDVYRRVENEL